MASLWCVSLNATSGRCLSHLLVAPDGEYTYIVVCNIDAVAMISISVAHTLKLNIFVFFKYSIIVEAGLTAFYLKWHIRRHFPDRPPVIPLEPMQLP